MRKSFRLLLAICFCTSLSQLCADDSTVRVFIFAGQSNMVGSDSKVKDIALYPPFAGSISLKRMFGFPTA